MKTIAELDQCLFDKVSFREICDRFEMTEIQIFDYIAVSFRNRYKKFYNDNIAYFSWGMTDDELNKENDKNAVKSKEKAFHDLFYYGKTKF